MDENPLHLDHNQFSFQIIKGIVTEAIMSGEVSESRHRAANTTIKNKHELWLKNEKGKEYHFVINANTHTIKEGQTLQILAAIHNQSAAAVLIYNQEENDTFANMSIWSLILNETPLLNKALLLFAIIGVFFIYGSVLFAVIYACVVLFGIGRLASRFVYYQKKLDTIKEDYLIKDVS